MKAFYTKGIEWIAHNDEPLIMDVDDMADLISVVMLADLCGKDPVKVANDVVERRSLLKKKP